MADGASHKECDVIKWFPDCILLFPLIIVFALYSMLPLQSYYMVLQVQQACHCWKHLEKFCALGMIVVALEYHKISCPFVPPELYHRDLGKELSVSMKIFLRVLI
jgi:hypothetical protein